MIKFLTSNQGKRRKEKRKQSPILSWLFYELIMASDVFEGTQVLFNNELLLLKDLFMSIQDLGEFQISSAFRTVPGFFNQIGCNAPLSISGQLSHQTMCDNTTILNNQYIQAQQNK